MSVMNKYAVLILSVLLLISCNDDVGIEINDDQSEFVFMSEPFVDNSLNHYFISANIDTEKDLIKATQILTYTHNEDVDLDVLYFHLYPNAFDKDKHPSLFDKDMDEIDTQGGYVNIESITINDVNVDYEITSIDTVLKIDYEEKFSIGESYNIELIYEIGIPTASERFGVANGIYNLGNWYPVLAVFDEDGWNLDPYYNIGDPFYSESSNYDLEITVANDFVLANSGYITDIIMDDHNRTYILKAGQIRDFALASSDRFNVISSKVRDTTVILYYPTEHKGSEYLKHALDAAVNSINLYSDVIGAYPYKTYSVVMTNFPTGMEYPGLVLISSDYLYGSLEVLKEVIIHETAHQWFYGIIGNDQIDEGWIDEGLTSYMTSYYNLDLGSKKTYKSIIKNYKSKLESVGGKDNIVMIKSAKDYSDWSEYGLAAYTKSPLMFSQLYDLYGEDKMKEFLKTLYNEYKFKILKQEDLVDVATRIFGEELNEFFIEWLK